jgi:hypothetical protein
MVDKNIGFYAELGYSRNGYISMGVVYRIVPAFEEKEKINMGENQEGDGKLDEKEKEK